MQAQKRLINFPLAPLAAAAAPGAATLSIHTFDLPFGSRKPLSAPLSTMPLSSLIMRGKLSATGRAAAAEQAPAATEHRPPNRVPFREN